MRHKMAWQSTLEYIRETDTFLVNTRDFHTKPIYISVNTNNKSMTNYHDMKKIFFE